MVCNDEEEKPLLICTYDNTQYCRLEEKTDGLADFSPLKMKICQICLVAYGVRELKLLRATGIQP